MSNQPDETTHSDEPTGRQERAPSDYYYDDGTGYTIYNPAEEAEEEEEADADDAARQGRGFLAEPERRAARFC